MGGYDQKYRCEHLDAKGRIAEWLVQQPSVVSDTELSWSVVTTGPYMELLQTVSGPHVHDPRENPHMYPTGYAGSLSSVTARSCSTHLSAMVTCP
jgi:hypothetical protein